MEQLLLLIARRRRRPCCFCCCCCSPASCPLLPRAQLVLQQLLSGRRLVLVLDLDHTLLNSAKFAEVDGEWEYKLETLAAEQVRPAQASRPAGQSRGCCSASAQASRPVGPVARLLLCCCVLLLGRAGRPVLLQVGHAAGGMGLLGR